MAEAILEGVKEAGGDATILQIPETLNDEILGKVCLHIHISTYFNDPPS